MSNFGQAKEVVRDTSEIIKPRERISVAEAATRRTVYSPGAYHGPWSNDIAPYMVEPMNMTESLEHEAVIFVGPARTLKTDALIMNTMFYNGTVDTSDFLLVNMTMQTARDFVKKDIKRLFTYNPSLKSRLAEGKHADNTTDKHFKNGMVWHFGWPSGTQLASKTLRRCAVTDYDRIPDDIDGEGSAFLQLMKRNQTFNKGRIKRGMTIVESSPGRDIQDPQWRPSSPHEAPPTTGIMALYNQGDRRLWYWPCLHCGEYSPCSFANLIFDVTAKDEQLAADKAVYACPHCGGIMEPKHKREMNARGAWLGEGQSIDASGTITGTPRKSVFASFWLEGPAAAFQTWQSLALKYILAMREFERTGATENLKVTVNTDQGRPFLSPALMSENDADKFQERAEATEQHKVPDGVRFLLATVDVQNGKKGRFVVQVEGFGVGLESWVIDRFDIRYTPDRLDSEGKPARLQPHSHVEDWDLLIAEVIDKTYELDDDSGRHIGIRYVCCDLGGNAETTANAYAFFRKLKKLKKHSHFRLSKGGSGQNIPAVRESYPDNRERGDRKADARGEIPVLIYHPNKLKDELDAHLGRDAPGPNFVHLPDWLPDWWFKELTAETRTAAGWKNMGNARNEAFDLMYMARGLLKYIKADKIDWAKPPSWARPMDRNSSVLKDEQTVVEQQTKPTTKRKRRTYNAF